MLAEYMFIRHHSAVGLLDRLAERGLVERVRGSADRRQVRVRLAPEGWERLRRLSAVHRRELTHFGPALSEALQELLGNVASDPDQEREEEGDVSTAKDRCP
jgi:DNA-binding MarR family transcriptional regulator